MGKAPTIETTLKPHNGDKKPKANTAHLTPGNAQNRTRKLSVNSSAEKHGKQLFKFENFIIELQ